jgi:hypothetical protein
VKKNEQKKQKNKKQNKKKKTPISTFNKRLANTLSGLPLAFRLTIYKISFFINKGRVYITDCAVQTRANS